MDARCFREGAKTQARDKHVVFEWQNVSDAGSTPAESTILCIKTPRKRGFRYTQYPNLVGESRSPIGGNNV